MKEAAVRAHQLGKLHELAARERQAEQAALTDADSLSSTVSNDYREAAEKRAELCARAAEVYEAEIERLRKEP